MNNLKKQTYDQLRRRRDLMLNAKAFSIDDEDRESFQAAISGLEEEMYRRTAIKVRAAVIVVSILVLVSIFTFGCQTFKGAMGDSAWLLQKGADNISTEK